MKLKSAVCFLVLAILVSIVGCESEPTRQPQSTPVAGLPQSTQITSPLPDGAFKAEIKPIDPPTKMRSGEKRVVQVAVSNISQNLWPALGEVDGKFAITLRNRWLDPDGKKVVNDLDGGTSLPHDLTAAGVANMTITITAPKEPGQYLLEFDMVQEQVNFFHDRGSQPAAIKVSVE
jgi:hypothetical protein